MFALFKKRLPSFTNQELLGRNSWKLEKKVATSFVVTVASLSVISILVWVNISQLIEANRQLDQAYLRIVKLEALNSEIFSAEAGQRGYIITGNERYLEGYYLAIADINQSLDKIDQQAKNDPTKQQRLQTLKPIIEKRLANLAEVLDARYKGGFVAAQRLIGLDVGRKLSNEIYRSINGMKQEAEQQQRYSLENAQRKSRNTLFILGFGGLFIVLLLTQAGLMIKRDIEQKQESETRLQINEQNLKISINELEKRNDEIEQLGELSNVLQSCITLEEAYIVLGALLSRLFPETIGGLFITNESKNLVERVAHWGEHPSLAESFLPSDCWALRRGQPYFSFHKDSSLHCNHVDATIPIQTLCIPMVAQGDALGILHFIFTETGQSPEPIQLLAKAVTENISTAIANLKLRESLKEQSIRDIITGLFNRRYLEENLEQEIQRAERYQKSFGIIMLDVDYFKKFNDNFGHDAGDLVLRELGQFLKSEIRGSDIACRYGGEEFLLVLPEASLEMTEKRAEEICAGVKNLVIEYRHQILGSITVSLGVASFPRNGHTVESLLRSSDIALYQAKKEGRDRVMVAEKNE